MGGFLWRKQSRSTFPNEPSGRRTFGSRPTRGPRAWMNSRSRISRLLGRTTSTSSGTGWHRELFSATGKAGGNPQGKRWCAASWHSDGCRSDCADGREDGAGAESGAHFHSDSYGYRPGKSAIDAVGTARQRCWRYDWVVDLDVRAFFDSVDHSLLMRAVCKHSDCKWTRLYIERWLKAPVQHDDGTLEAREKGTPQGSVVSPLLANLFLHYAFDAWMVREYPDMLFERYADDALVHCRTKSQARRMVEAIAERLATCGLEIHPEKTKIVYCKDGQRKRDWSVVQFDFLGFSFQPRSVKARWGNLFLSFSPAVSAKAAKAMRQTIRSWKIHRWTQLSIDELAESFNPVIRGWINYYGSFYRSKLSRIFQQLDFALVRWVKRKYKRKGSLAKATEWLRRLTHRQPQLFAHWPLTLTATVGR